MDSPEGAPINRNALTSVLAGVLAVASWCTGAAPIPLTGFVCFPVAAMLGMLALASGLISLAQVRPTGQRGKELAIAGIWMGGPAVAATLVMAGLGMLIFPRILDWIRTALP